MASSRNDILVVVALSAWIMVSNVPQGEAQQFPTPLNCLAIANNVPGCMNAFTQTIVHNNSTNLTPDCCKLVNGISDMCSRLLFPTYPEAIPILKFLCALANSPRPSPVMAPPPSV
ncbi:hypothetical protein M5689_011554 [Euphorbia peplus]|nr:hypothetical protein M5689_011554 [Euphorbia peplus]